MLETLGEHLLNLKKIFREAVQEALYTEGHDHYPTYSSPLGKVEDSLRQLRDGIFSLQTEIQLLNSNLTRLLEKENEKTNG